MKEQVARTVTFECRLDWESIINRLQVRKRAYKVLRKVLASDTEAGLANGRSPLGARASPS